MLYIDKATPSIINAHFKAYPALTTPMPDFGYSLTPNKLPALPLRVTLSHETQQLLSVAPHEIFLIWETKSGGASSFI